MEGYIYWVREIWIMEGYIYADGRMNNGRLRTLRGKDEQ